SPQSSTRLRQTDGNSVRGRNSNALLLGQLRQGLVDQPLRHLWVRTRVQERVELATVGPEQREHRRQAEQLLEDVRLADQLAFAIQAATLVLQARAARAGRISWHERNRRQARPVPGRRVR